MTFKEIGLNKPLSKAVEELGLVEPTTIQHKVFKPIIGGQDVIGIAQTGTGKTYAYLLPLLNMWKFTAKKVPEILIVVPTRELVAQVVEEVQKLAVYTDIKVAGVYGGASMTTQMLSLHEHGGVDLIVGTPGRVLDFLYNGAIKAKAIRKVVIDEVDEMLDLGFRTQLTNVLDLISLKHQTLMFSATLTEDVEEFIGIHFPNPIKIEAAPTGTPLENIFQKGYQVPNFNTKVNFLEHLLKTDTTMTKVLVFADSKKLADEIHARIEPSFSDQMAVIHSNKSQTIRFKTVADFEKGNSRILIATDLFARGLDVSGVSHVINMDVPPNPENYIHRIGRTGRAGMPGISITFVSERDKEYLEQVEEMMGRSLELDEMPAEVQVSKLLIADEQTFVPYKVLGKPAKAKKSGAFHEKLEKNKQDQVPSTYIPRRKGSMFGLKNKIDPKRKRRKS